MENLPLYISIVFILTTLLTVFLFFKSAHYSLTVLILLLLWMIIQGIVSSTGFYTVTKGIPPRFALLGFPTLVMIICMFVTSKGRAFIDRLDLKTLTLLHIVRIPVEVVLFWLYIHKTIPGLMTFEGRNFDILSGITAPLIYYFGFIKRTLPKGIMIAWNIICLCLLVNIVINAVLSAPFAFQQFAFDQPDIAVLYFPFTWLPCLVVPVVLFSHLAAIRLLTKK